MPEPGHSARLIAALGNIGPRDHPALIYETQAEQFAAVAPFIRIGLERGDRCLYVPHDNPPQAVLEALQAEGIDVDGARQAGALAVLGAQETYLRQGRFDPDDMLAFWGQAAQTAQAAGFTGVRAAVEMTWALASGQDARRVMEYEARLNPHLAERQALTLCQYDRRQFPPETILDAIRTHPTVIYGGRVCANPYFLPAEEFLGSRQPEQEVQRLLANLSALEDTRQALAASEELHRLVLSQISDAVFITDDDGAFTYICANVDVIFGYSVEEARALGNIAGLIGADLFDPGQLAAGEIRNIERDVRDKAGQAHTLLISVKHMPAPNGNVLYTCRDITERKQAERELLDSRRRLEALVGLSHALAEAGADYPAVLNVVARRTAEAIGDGCVLTLLSEDGQTVQPEAFYHPRPEAAAWMAQTLPAAASPVGGRLFQQVVQRGEVVFLPVADEAQTRRALPAEYKSYIDHFGIASLIIVPLRIQGRGLGTLGLTRDRGGRPYTPEDQSFLQDLADRAALAIANAQLYRQVRAGRERLQALSRQLVELQESERRSIARELHDEVGQLLTGLQLTLAMEARERPAAATGHLREALNLTNEVIARVRDLSLTLRPAMLDDLGLLPALLWQTERFTAQTRVQVDLRHSGVEGRRFPPDIETAAYRVAQEALTNVARHSGVSQARVRLWADQEVVGVQIEDRGAGFDPREWLRAGVTGGLGGMRERVRLLGGQFTLEAAAGKGTRLTAEFPLMEPLERRERRA